LLRFFEPRLFSASDVENGGKAATDLFLLADARLRTNRRIASSSRIRLPALRRQAPRACGRFGFVGRHPAEGSLSRDLLGAGARAVIGDMRALKSAIVDLRGW
jgi:hypothetical protein